MQNREKHRLGINQIMVLNSFCSKKIKILDRVLEKSGKDKLDPIKQTVNQVESALAKVLDNMKAHEGEAPASKEMRKRGRVVLFRNTKENLAATQEELDKLSRWFSTQSFEQEDRQIITKALADIDEIVRSNLFIMGDEEARDVYDEFIDPDS